MDALRGNGVSRSVESTGIPRLDSVIGGGLLRPSITALVGAPGAGTTSFCKSFIVSSLKRGRNVILICGDESPDHYMRYFDKIESFDIASYVQQRRLFAVDLYEYCTELHGIHDLADLASIESVSLQIVISSMREALISKLNRQPQDFNIVIDSFTSFAPFIGVRDSDRAVLEGQRIARTGNHVIMVTAHEGVLEGNLVQQIRKLAQNVIRMRTRWVRSELERQMIIEKLSFMEIKQPILEYTISSTGVMVTEPYASSQ
jgi:KaiC/GvpD/RAD55 family RecA-like ATPase